MKRKLKSINKFKIARKNWFFDFAFQLLELIDENNYVKFFSDQWSIETKTKIY